MLLAVQDTLSAPLPLPVDVGSALSPFILFPSAPPWEEYTVCFGVWFAGG